MAGVEKLKQLGLFTPGTSLRGHNDRVNVPVKRRGINYSLLDTGQEGMDVPCSKSHLGCRMGITVQLSEVSKLGASLNFRV